MPGCFYIFFGVAFVGHDALLVNTEVLLLLPGLVGGGPVRDRQAAGRIGGLLLAGALIGVACLFKLPRRHLDYRRWPAYRRGTLGLDPRCSCAG